MLMLAVAISDHLWCFLQHVNCTFIKPSCRQKRRLATNARAAKVIQVVALVMLSVSIAEPLRAQLAQVTQSGRIADLSGADMPDPKFPTKTLDFGHLTIAQPISSRPHSLPKLTPAEIKLSSSSDDLGAKAAEMTLAGGGMVTSDEALEAPQNQVPSEQLPDAPSVKTAPSLEDLGITPEQEQGNAKEQALLDKRTHMLKIHQRLGLITLVPLVATVVTSMDAGGKNTTSTDRTVHMLLGSTTADLYFTTAYFAIRAPRIAGTESRGQIRLHKALAWVHGPGMVLTPILGAIAYSQKNNGEKVHGIASAHGPVAIVTASAYAAALLSVSVKF
jgi:hypothetical protein